MQRYIITVRLCECLLLLTPPRSGTGKDFKRSVAESVSVEFFARQGLALLFLFRNITVVGAHDDGVPLNEDVGRGTCG